MSSTYAELLAHEIHGISYDGLTAEDIAMTKFCLLDFLGAAIGGSLEESSRIVREWVTDNGGKEEVPIFLSPRRYPAHMAAFANGTMAHTIELDDVNMHCFGHPAVAIIPAVLASAYVLQASGIRTLESILSGYETMGRLGMYLTEDHYRYWHSTSTMGTFGAAVGAGKARGFSTEQLVHAIGIAGSFASGLREVFVGGTSCKHIHAGRAAQNGVLCCEFAERGITGPKTILDGNMGINKAMTTRVDPEGLLKEHHPLPEIHYTEFKPYASCRSAHAAVDCVLNMHKRAAIDVAKIDRIDITTTTIICNDPSWGCLNPENSLAGRLSIPFNTAVVLMDGACTMAQFVPQKIHDPAVKQLLEKITLIRDARIDSFYPEVAAARVKVTFCDQTEMEEEVIYPKGHPQNALTSDELISKFLSLAMMRLSEETSHQIVDCVMHLEELADIRQLVDLLCIGQPN